ncbi:MAG: DUF4157 domain-containing protein [Bacteroidetes bacterium]|nr:DUF4157 domain-containing protein [Bacteroidota bacterium]MBS1630590.1 DUF4157 domain-containing protein [Bacteroidota bacterium]
MTGTKKPDASFQEKKKDEDKKVQRKGPESSGPIPTTSSLASPGSENSLPADMNRFFSQTIGRDFSDVKIHTGSEANKAAHSVQARAYTLGNHIVFAEGEYSPGSTEGKHLLAHELAHVAQQDPGKLRRKEEPSENTETESAAPVAPLQDDFLGTIALSGSGMPLPSVVAYANCAGARVSGLTTANYDHGTYSVSGAALKRAKDCKGCAEVECVTVSGVIVHQFSASPTVDLPTVPPGNWSECEKKAIQTFIDTTLSQHEQKHVAAFKTYNGSVKTPFTYTGCKDGLDAYVAGIHNKINSDREAATTAKSDVYDANGANQFNIACDCPDPKPKEAEADSES